MSTVAQLRAAIEAAEQKMKKGRAGLFDQRGRQLHSDEIHAERLADLRSEFERSTRDIARELNTIVNAADAEIEQGHLDPIHTMVERDLQAITLRQSMVERDWANRPLAEMVREAEAAIRDGDRAARYLMWKFGSERLRTLNAVERDPTSGQYRPVAGASSTDRRLAHTLVALAERLERSLIDVDARQRAREEATARRDEAADLLIELGTRGYMDQRYSTPPAVLSRVPAARQSRFPSPTVRA